MKQYRMLQLPQPQAARDLTWLKMDPIHCVLQCSERVVMYLTYTRPTGSGTAFNRSSPLSGHNHKLNKNEHAVK